MDWSSIGWPALIGVLGYVGSRLVERSISFFSDGAAALEARRNADADRIEAVAFEIRDLACEYWTEAGSEQNQKRRAASVTGRLSFLAAVIDELFRDRPVECGAAQTVLQQFHEACTGGDFGVLARESDPERCQEIEVAAYALAHKAASLRRRLPRRLT